jgi:outer membrane protein assembly factor BamB
LPPHNPLPAFPSPLANSFFRTSLRSRQETVLVDSFSGYLYSLDGETGAVVWKQKLGSTYLTGGGAASSPRIAGGRVYVGGPDGIWAFDVVTGERLWKHEVGTQCGSSPEAFGDGLVAIACEDGYLYILRG